MEDHSYHINLEKANDLLPLSIRKAKQQEATRNRLRRHDKTRINIGGIAFPKWKSLRSEKDFQSDASVACFLLDNHIDAGEVFVKLECLLQLFYKCYECRSESSIGTKRDGRFLYVRQRCQQCHSIRVWRSHPPDHINSSPAANKEVAEETILLSFGDTESEGEGEEEVKGHDSLSQSGKGNKEDKEISCLYDEIVAMSVEQSGIPSSIKEEEQEPSSLNPWSQKAEAELPLVSTSVEKNQLNDMVAHTAGALDNRSNDQEADGRKDGCNLTHSGEEIVVKMEEQDVEVNVKLEQEDQADELEEGEDENDSEGNEDEEMEIEDSEDDDYVASDAADADWDPAAAGYKLLSATENVSRSNGDQDSESEVLLPLVWCRVCGSGFKHDCFRQRHSRLYGCIKCGTRKHKQTEKDGEITEVTNNNQRTSSDQETSNQEASNNNGEGDSTSETIHGRHNETTGNGCQEEAPCTNNEREPDKEHARSLHIENVAVLFKSLHDFKTHAIQCHGITRFRSLCTDCGKFITMVNMVDGGPRHICEHKAKPIVCSSCGKRFTSELGLQTHVKRIHNEKYRLTCRYCLKAFKSPEDKEEHEEDHAEELLKYHCPDCPQRFPDRSSWCAHRKSHWPNGKHICEVCNKSLCHDAALIRHMRVHTGLKPYICEMCDRSFNQAGHLKSHMRVHTGEKPFKCQDCGLCFNHNVSLMNHIKRHHEPAAEEKKRKGRGRRKNRST